MSNNERKKLNKIKRLEDRLSEISISKSGAVSYRITNLFNRRINNLKNSIKR